MTTVGRWFPISYGRARVASCLLANPHGSQGGATACVSGARVVEGGLDVLRVFGLAAMRAIPSRPGRVGSTTRRPDGV
eukprot:2434279-Pyramimonas_sp.AAC.1